MTLNKYQDMTALASRLNEVSQRLNDKCEWLSEASSVDVASKNSLHYSSPAVVSLQPYCDQIDQVEVSVSALEQMAYRLDAYCKRLGKARSLDI